MDVYGNSISFKNSKISSRYKYSKLKSKLKCRGVSKILQKVGSVQINTSYAKSISIRYVLIATNS